MSQIEEIESKIKKLEEFKKSIDPLIDAITPLIEQYKKLSEYLCYIITAWSSPSTYNKASESLEDIKNKLISCKANCSAMIGNYNKEIEKIRRMESVLATKAELNSNKSETNSNLRPSYKNYKSIEMRY